MTIIPDFKRLKYILLNSLCLLFISFINLAYADNSDFEDDLSRAAIEDIDANSRFIIYYGDEYYLKDEKGNMLKDKDNRWILNKAIMDKLVQFDFIVLQPNQPHCTPEVIDYLQDHGVDYVLGYISIGEQSAVKAAQGDGSGPMRYDVTSNRLKPSYQGIASFYMDVDSQQIIHNEDQSTQIITSARKTPDNQPDVNPHFAGYMIYPDAAWREILQNMRIGKNSTRAGLDQLILPPSDAIELAQKRDQNFGFDGFFLDTIDTAGPYDGIGWYPWALEAMRDTVKFISDSYPEKVVFANRGSFYFQKGLKSPVTQQSPIDFSIRPYINAFLFESYLYDSDPSFDGIDQKSEFYYDNRHKQMPQIMAEAQREDGFSVFILEYDAGRSQTVQDFTKIVVDEDIATWGATTYISDNGRLDSINTTLFSHLPYSLLQQ